MEDDDRTKLDLYWASYTEQANEITSKRQTLNSIYLTLEAGLVGFSVAYLKLIGLFLSIAGLLLCVVWIMSIISFKKLNSAKFEIIFRLEERINVSINPYKLEWDILQKKKYIKFTTLELITTVLISCIFVVILILSIISLF